MLYRLYMLYMLYMEFDTRPSHDHYHKLRSLVEIQKCGCWTALSSVSRYEKHSKLLRQIQCLSAEEQKLCADEGCFPLAVIAA